MRYVWVVQRYGPEIVGGAEAEARQYATRLASAGHSVHVVTTCALDYVTWRDEFAPGLSDDEGVTVERLSVPRGRSDRFWELDRRVREGLPRGLVIERDWVRAQGPVPDRFAAVIAHRAADADVVVFTSFLYYPTIVGLPVARQRAATALTPTAHREPAFELSVIVPPLLLADGLLYNSAEERALVTERVGRPTAGEVVGMGLDDHSAPDVPAFRQRFGLAADPYLLYVGRIDEQKGVQRLFDWFVAFKERHRGPLRLVLMGSSALDLPDRSDVVRTGFVSEPSKAAGIAGALALAQPSRMESFSIVSIEAWAAGTPVLCDAGSEVVVGHAMRSGGGIPFRGFPDFEAAVEMLLEDPVARQRLGAAGRAYVDANYRWPQVMRRLERALGAAHERGVTRLAGR